MATQCRCRVQDHTPILFYDGECGLCSRAVQWCLRHDHNRVLRFAPLQGTTYAALRFDDKPSQLDTLVFADADGLHVRSSGALRAMRLLGGPWGVLAVMCYWLVPRVLRDRVYRFIAARRLGWFGPADQCAMPGDDDRLRFLP